jgi:hypothetical protein
MFLIVTFFAIGFGWYFKEKGLEYARTEKDATLPFLAFGFEAIIAILSFVFLNSNEAEIVLFVLTLIPEIIMLVIWLITPPPAPETEQEYRARMEQERENRDGYSGDS